MAGGSIDALIERCDARRQEFDLRVRDGAVLSREIAHRWRRQVHGLKHVPPVDHGTRHEAKSPMNIATAPLARARIVPIEIGVLR